MVNKEPKTEKAQGIAGGEGFGAIKMLVDSCDLYNKAGLLAEVMLEPGSSVGYHKHEGEGEMYYILTGEGDYTEDGVTTRVSEGMVTCVYDGHSHGLKNTGSVPMTFVAVIVKE
jgi:mannose-6-phosphate isomerase-like protein (cupin superfamily)